MVELVLQLKRMCICCTVGALAFFFWVKGDKGGLMAFSIMLMTAWLSVQYVLSGSLMSRLSEPSIMSALRTRTVERVLQGHQVPYAVTAARYL